MKTVGIKPGESTVKDGWDESRDNVFDTVHSVDDMETFVLARLGKRQVLKVCSQIFLTYRLAPTSNSPDPNLIAQVSNATQRNFGFMSTLTFSCTVLVTWEGVYTSVPDYKNCGSAGLVYGYIFIWAGTLSTFTSIAELASIAPTSDGQYHWVAMLAPASSRKFMSYLTGMLSPSSIIE